MKCCRRRGCRRRRSSVELASSWKRCVKGIAVLSTERALFNSIGGWLQTRKKRSAAAHDLQVRHRLRRGSWEQLVMKSLRLSWLRGFWSELGQALNHKKTQCAKQYFD